MPTHKERAEKRNVSLSKLPLLNWDFKPGDEVMFIDKKVVIGIVEDVLGNRIKIQADPHLLPSDVIYPAHPETRRFLNYVIAMTKRLETTECRLHQRINLWREQTKTGRATGENPNFKP